MALPFFEAGVQSGVASSSPNDKMRDMLQNYVYDQWENSTAIVKLKEQDEFGVARYTEVEAMIASVRDLTTTGLAVSRDFLKVFFKDFDHVVTKGRYYQFEDCYWMVDDVSPYEGVAPLVSLRRCNNALRLIDPVGGKVFSAPCVVDYDMTSPQEQQTKYVITPNNHATVQVQANDDTMRLFTYNKRFILGGRPFKLLAWQNALLHEDNLPKPTVLYLDLYLDELHAEDDLANGIADNGQVDVVTPVGGIEPPIDSIRQYEAITYRTDASAMVSVEPTGYVTVSTDGDGFTLSCDKVSSSPIKVSVTMSGKTTDYDLRTLSMFGG